MPAITGVILGVGLYSYVASWIVMPALLLVTHGVLWRAGKRAPRMRRWRLVLSQRSSRSGPG